MTYTDAVTFTVTASTKRNPAPAGGKVGVPVAKLTTLKIMPLVPAPIDVLEYYRLRSARDVFVTYAEGAPDILEGDILTVAGRTQDTAAHQRTAHSPRPLRYGIACTHDRLGWHEAGPWRSSESRKTSTREASL